jgi:hypothetical protein
MGSKLVSFKMQQDGFYRNCFMGTSFSRFPLAGDAGYQYQRFGEAKRYFAARKAILGFRDFSRTGGRTDIVCCPGQAKGTSCLKKP